MRIWLIVATTVLFSVVHANIQISDPLFRDDARVDYLIISASDQGILEQAERLAEMKWKKGLKSRVVTVNQIARAIHGRDIQHSIRMFLKQAYKDLGVTWVLLFGDLKHVPARSVSTGGLYFPYDTTAFESDVYYACLEGEWDNDNDGVYGNGRSTTSYRINCEFLVDSSTRCEMEQYGFEGLDLWYDVYLGRLPASNAEEAETMVDKIVAYRTTPRPATYADDMVFMAGQVHSVWKSYADNIECDDATYYWHYRVKPYFDQTMGFTNLDIDEVYEDRVLPDGRAVNDSVEITLEKITETFSRGYNMAFFTFHGNPRGVRICSMTDDGTHRPDYTHLHVRDIRNDYYSNILSISCSVMKMVPDSQYCFAKSFLVNKHGGGVSYTGSSGIDYFNIRGRHYQRAIEYMTNKGVFRIAKAFQLANIKEFCRHNMFVHQHWGDPELELWTTSATPADSFAISVALCDSEYVVRLEPALDSALVCAYKQDEVFLRGYTTAGVVRFDAVEASVEGITVTATAHNRIPSSIVMNNHAVIARRVAEKRGGEIPRIRVHSHSGRTRVVFAGVHGPVDARLFTMSGRMVSDFRSEKPAAEWHVGALPSGGYVVRTRSGGRSMITRFIIKR